MLSNSSNNNIVLANNHFQPFAHPFHLVTSSPWPIVVSFATLSAMLTLALTMHGYIADLSLFWVELIVLATSITLWVRDVITEASFLGDHTKAVRKGLEFGFNLFVLSEILIFAALFWAYLHSAMNPTPELGLQWAPLDIEKVEAMELPLLNTVILLSSGATVTYAHHAWINNSYKGSAIFMTITTLLIVIFVGLQFCEYLFALFTITDGVYGSVFYAGTGLHMFHMMTLIIMLSITTVRVYKRLMSQTHSVNLDLTIIYSHVLDVIWLALFVLFYVWV